MVPEVRRSGVVILAAAVWGGRGAGFAREFARRGHPVAHVSPELEPGASGWHALHGEWLPAGVRRVALPSASARSATDEWSPGDLLRAHDALVNLVETQGVRCPAVVVQSAGWAHLASAFRELTDFPLVCDLPAQEAIDTPWLVDSADLVLAHSTRAGQRLRELHWHVVVVPDGCDAQRWRRAPRDRRPAVLRPPLSGPLVGYAGDGPVDARIVSALAELRPDWTFPLLTTPSAADRERFDQIGNVFVMPNVLARARPRFVAEFDVGLIALEGSSSALGRFPAEALELLAAGKPVVATAHPDLFELQPAGVAIGATPLELAAAVEHALGETRDTEAGHVAAATASWRERVDRFACELEALTPSLDVVVVSYDNPPALARCLSSLRRDASHPAQLIVVDNASGDETGVVLDHAEAEGAIVERLTVNEGFPAAVNRGIALGSGRYVLILNDDVQMPAGGLLALVHALARSRRVGLAGPVTNSIANQARIHVAYEDRHPADRIVDGVHRECAATHAGISADIEAAALFAAIARRADVEALGGISARYQLGQFDDDDFSHRMRSQLGLRVVCAEDVFVHHAGMTAFGALDRDLLESLFARNRRVFERATQTVWQPHRDRYEELE